MCCSVLILTYNEGGNIRDCLKSVSWSDDIIVLDSYSTDDTVATAQATGVRVFQRHFDTFAGQRNHAIDQIKFRNEWILHLDADERCTEPLYKEIRRAAKSETYDAFRIPSKMMLHNHWLRFSGMYPSYQVRLARHPGFRFKQVGHGQREDIAANRVGTLSTPYLHYSFSKGLEEWLAKHNRYSTDEAREWIKRENYKVDWPGLFSVRDITRRRRALKSLSYQLPLRPQLRFIYMYLLRGGVLDGRAGYLYCRLMATYEAMIDFKIQELLQAENALTERPSTKHARKAA